VRKANIYKSLKINRNAWTAQLIPSTLAKTPFLLMAEWVISESEAKNQAQCHLRCNSNALFILIARVIPKF